MNSGTRKKIIVAADDFGISEMANDRILELAKAGKIDRVAVMADGMLSQEEINDLLHLGIKLDIHLNITEKFKTNRKLKEGIIKRSVMFLTRYVGREISASKVKKEWEGQILKFKEMIGKYPDGINSHQHVHYYPSYFKATSELAKKYSCSYIRCGKKGFLGKMNGVKQILSAFRRIDTKYLKKNNIDSSDYLVSFDWIKDFAKFSDNFPEGTVEITFHPERKEEFEAINKFL